MHPALAADLDRFDQLLDAARARAVAALRGLADRPVAAPAPGAPGPYEPLPERGAGGAAALARFGERWEPGLSGSAGPRYLGFVTGGATPAAVAGDWLVGAYDQNVVAAGDSAATDLERETVGWLRELFGLGEAHAGAFVSGATMSNAVGLAVAREWLGERLGVSVADAGAGALGEVAVLSGAAHSSVPKALSLLGLGRDALREVPLLPGREAVDVAELAAALAALDGRPAIVVANSGTVNTVDFDDLRAIAALRERYPFWLHVDAAFGAFAALSPEHAHLVAGLDTADSVCVDLHKWLNVPYDAAVQFTRRRDLQVRVFRNAAAYMAQPGDDPDFVHLTPENSRRLRALPAWLTLAAYGREGHREVVERNAALARRFGSGVADGPGSGLRLLAPVRLNVVCFTLAAEPTRERVAALAAAVAASGEAVVTPTVYGGTHGLRAAFSNWRTGPEDVDRAVAALVNAARRV
ncbi:pyridoxal phosphate-dependent decarboxylase family protein [Streptomyces sp. CMB-StM0423]|uniref:pyridoxal phosphate-dependent decarboxylase family protein n=1 Tax=Streptomyces sp. CMB-StM0423 TaxID=2059884 RepID=UPI000C7050D1|nr:pyridoxal-dependent decarboxylase [Streptomyces sp. CMB-StM0423]AUH43257.1 aspartate aminotransferase family protein [Streptomyces sp. CMB-StM0423]